MDANITPLLDAVGEQLEELVIDETRWTRDENGEKVYRLSKIKNKWWLSFPSVSVS